MVPPLGFGDVLSGEGRGVKERCCIVVMAKARTHHPKIKLFE